MATTTVHMYYYNPKLIDLAKLREQACEIATGDYRTKPRPVVLHFHGARESCMGRIHEEFPLVEEG